MNVTMLSNMFETDRRNMQKILKEMVEWKLLFRYNDIYEINYAVDISELEFRRRMKGINKKHGAIKAKKTLATKAKSNTAVKTTTPVGVKNTAPPEVNNTADSHANLDQGAVNNTPNSAMNNTTLYEPSESPINKGLQDGFAYPNNTNDNTIHNSNKDIIEIDKENITNNSNSLMGKKNSLDVILKNSQFKNIYDYHKWDQYDISKYSDSYIAHLVIEKKLNDNPTGLEDKKLDSFLVFIVQYALHEDTPPNDLKDAIEYQLKQNNQEDQIKKLL
jgi:hypothetical protein